MFEIHKVTTRLKSLAYILVLSVFVAGQSGQVLAISKEQRTIFNKNINYFDYSVCEDAGTNVGSLQAGQGQPEGATFPNLPPEAMAKGIDKYIQKTNPNSKMKGLGATIVAGAENSNVSPFLIVAIAQKESSLSNPSDYNVSHGNNSFGRTATSSQPNFSGARLWYKWSTVKASVDNTAHENKNAGGGGDIAAYIREVYKEALDEGDLVKLFMKYAPPFENDTTQYINDVKSWVKEMVKLTNEEGGGAATATPASPSGNSCCATGPAPASEALTGNDNAEKAFNYFINQGGLSTTAAAGLVGNFQVESGDELDVRADNGSHKGIVQWDSGRWAGLVESANGKEYTLKAQLDYVMKELNGDYEDSTLKPLKAADSSDEAAKIVFEKYEIAGDSTLPKRQANAQKILNAGGGASPADSPAAAACAPAGGDANLKKTITVDSKGKFITMPGKYGCSGSAFRIDSRIAASVAYLVTKYNMCITAGLEDGHASHGAGLAIDAVPKSGDGKEAWVGSTEAAARDIGWFGDSYGDAKGSKQSCAGYSGYGECMHSVYPDKFPKWMRWMGYNGATCHGDSAHIFGGCGAHLHIGWDTPNGDGVSSSEIPEPRSSVYTFPAPLPDDIKGLVD